MTCYVSDLSLHNCLSYNHAIAVVQVLELSGPHEVPAFHWLTGWLREDVMPVTSYEGAAQASQAKNPVFCAHAPGASAGLLVAHARLVLEI